MPVGDERTIHRPPRVDVKATGAAEKAAFGEAENIGTGHAVITLRRAMKCHLNIRILPKICAIEQRREAVSAILLSIRSVAA
jgi:hypothetical protein